MEVTIWGCRGSLATPGPSTVRYGGNTTSVEVRTAKGAAVVLDAGTGIRPLGLALHEQGVTEIDLLLTHLHLDHVEGLGFFAVIFDEGAKVRIWGPRPDEQGLAAHIERYLSPPFFPLRFDTLPAQIEIHELGEERLELGGLSVEAARVRHPGPTLGYRLTEGDASFAFVPDNEPALDPSSGLVLADGADLLLHDAQYTDAEYETRSGWGHSSAAAFSALVREAQPRRAVMFHHDPSHDDAKLEAMEADVRSRVDIEVGLAAEGLRFRL